MLLKTCTFKHSNFIYLSLYRYLFEGCYFGAIMGSAKIEKIKCQLYTVIDNLLILISVPIIHLNALIIYTTNFYVQYIFILITSEKIIISMYSNTKHIPFHKHKLRHHYNRTYSIEHIYLCLCYIEGQGITSFSDTIIGAICLTSNHIPSAYLAIHQLTTIKCFLYYFLFYVFCK